MQTNMSDTQGIEASFSVFVVWKVWQACIMNIIRLLLKAGQFRLSTSYTIQCLSISAILDLDNL